jgi:hypothetical protein
VKRRVRRVKLRRMRIDVTGRVAIETLVPQGRYEGSLARSAWKLSVPTVPSRRLRCDRSIVAATQTEKTFSDRSYESHTVPPGPVGLLPRSGYTEQPRALALGQVVSKSARKAAPDFGHAAGITREQPKDAPRPPLSGRICATDNPGLKPWAIMYSRFASKLYSRHFVPGYLHRVPPGQNRSSLQCSTNVSRKRTITKR